MRAGLLLFITILLSFGTAIAETPANPTTLHNETAVAQQASKNVGKDKLAIERGRYLVIIGSCNDCHTPHFPESGGKVPEKDWLTGVPVGWKGPWGVSYATNLRKLAAKLSSDEWIKHVRTFPARPPMPAYIFQTMTETDIRGLHAYIRSLGDAGEDMPAALAPGQQPKTAYIDVTPVFPPQAMPSN